MATATEYRRHTIKSMKVAGEWSARAFRHKVAVGNVHTGATEQDAIVAVKNALDATRSGQLALRCAGIPTALEYRALLATIIMTVEQRAMLDAHLRASDHILTATELAHAGGYDSYVSANNQYGKLARKIAEELEWEPPIFRGQQTWTFALATGADDGEDSNTPNWRWRLRTELVEALQR